MAKFDDLLQAVKVHEVLKSKEENEKKCKFCKRIIVGKSKLGICPDCWKFCIGRDYEGKT